MAVNLQGTRGRGDTMICRACLAIAPLGPVAAAFESFCSSCGSPDVQRRNGMPPQEPRGGGDDLRASLVAALRALGITTREQMLTVYGSVANATIALLGPKSERPETHREGAPPRPQHRAV